MKLSITEAATLLGKSQRQIRYLIRTERLPAAKVGSRWRIDSAALPLSDAERQELAQRSELARKAFEKALQPAIKAARPGSDEAAAQRGAATPGSEASKRSYSVTDLLAFQAGEDLYRELARGRGRDDPICRTLFEALVLVARGCHCYHPREKAGRFGEARELAATVVAQLLLDDGDAAGRRALAERVEQELIPKLAGLVAAYEKRGRQNRFDGFGRKSFEPVSR